MIRHRAAILADHGSITGIVGRDIIVLPDMNPSREVEVLQAKATVSEVGGMLAHLAIVSREARKTMMVMPDACTLLLPGTKITMNPSRCEILIHPAE